LQCFAILLQSFASFSGRCFGFELFPKKPMLESVQAEHVNRFFGQKLRCGAPGRARARRGTSILWDAGISGANVVVCKSRQQLFETKMAAPDDCWRDMAKPGETSSRGGAGQQKAGARVRACAMNNESTELPPTGFRKNRALFRRFARRISQTDFFAETDANVRSTNKRKEAVCRTKLVIS